jgi:hypothetical protein
VSENGVLKKISESKRNAVSREFWILHNKDICNLLSMSPKIVVTKEFIKDLTRKSDATRKAYRILVGSLLENNHLQDHEGDWRISRQILGIYVVRLESGWHYLRIMFSDKFRY